MRRSGSWAPWICSGVATPPDHPELIFSATDRRREIYLLTLDDPAELPGSFVGIEPRFAALLVWNADELPPATISAVLEFLYRIGCLYLSTWGRDCERVHDIMDEIVAWLEIDEGPNPFLRGPDDQVMTTWHTKSFGDALFYLVCCAHPHGSYESFAQSIVITIGASDATLAQVRAALQDPFEPPSEDR